MQVAHDLYRHLPMKIYNWSGGTRSVEKPPDRRSSKYFMTIK
jgi:hypothetical protein